jgi:hypothetical protein
LIELRLVPNEIRIRDNFVRKIEWLVEQFGIDSGSLAQERRHFALRLIERCLFSDLVQDHKDFALANLITFAYVYLTDLAAIDTLNDLHASDGNDIARCTGDLIKLCPP